MSDSQSPERLSDANGQRRHVAVMFSDVCDYTKLSEILDPEAVDAIRERFDELASSVVQAHAGHVTQVYGDGQLCVFGYPQPSEDDARRCIDAALELHDKVRASEWPDLPAGFQMRLHTGIHMGLVFIRIGTELHGRYKISGDTVNTAARLSSAAQADQILVSAAALGGSEQFFETELVPALELKGKRKAQAVYRVAGRSNIQTRFEARSQRDLTPFVGRKEELSALLSRLTAPEHPAPVIVIGAPGIGKSRLLDEFALRARAGGATVLRGTCESYGELVPLQPFAQLLAQAFGTAGMPAAQAKSSVAEQVEQLGAAVASHLRIYLSLMGIEPLLAHELTSAKVAAAMQQLLAALASPQPLVVIFDDWQWADDASRAVLGQLREPLLQLGSCLAIGVRGSSWIDPALQPCEVLTLRPLTQSDCLRFVAALQTSGLGIDISENVLELAGGNPLFLEELIRAAGQALWSERSPSEHNPVIPNTLQGVIQARISILPTIEQQLLGMAAVIGIEFNVQLLSELSQLALPALREHLDALCSADLIYQGDEPGVYHFKHGLTREIVYDLVLMSERAQIHRHAAAAIEQGRSLPENARQASLLAYHFRGSGQYEPAAQYAEVAGDRALAVSAIDRACQHYAAALLALDCLPASQATRTKWLAISEKWGLPFAYSPVRAQLDVLHTAVARALELEDIPAAARCGHSLGLAYYSLGDYRESITCYREAIARAEHHQEPRLLTQLHAGLGQSLVAAGDYATGIETLSAAIASKRKRAQSGRGRSDHVAQGFAYALSCLALAHADCGDFSLADEEFREALAALSGSDHAVVGAITGLQSVAHLIRGAWQDALDSARQSHENARRHGNTFTSVTSASYLACASWHLTGQIEHVHRWRAMVDWLEAQHLELYLSLSWAWLAHALQVHDEPSLARAYANRALKRAERNDPMGEAAAYRVLARLGPSDDTDSDYTARCLERATIAGQTRGARHEAVKTQLLRAELRQEHGEILAAQTWATHSLQAARELNMPWYTERAAAIAHATRTHAHPPDARTEPR